MTHQGFAMLSFAVHARPGHCPILLSAPAPALSQSALLLLKQLRLITPLCDSSAHKL